MRIELKNCKIVEAFAFSENAKSVGLILDDGYTKCQVSITKEMFQQLAGKQNVALNFTCTLKSIQNQAKDGRIFWNTTIFVTEVAEIITKWERPATNAPVSF